MKITHHGFSWGHENSPPRGLLQEMSIDQYFDKTDGLSAKEVTLHTPEYTYSLQKVKKGAQNRSPIV